MNEHNVFLKVCQFVERSINGCATKLSDTDKLLFGEHCLIYQDKNAAPVTVVSDYAFVPSRNSYRCLLEHRDTGRKLKPREVYEIMEELEHQLTYSGHNNNTAHRRLNK